MEKERNNQGFSLVELIVVIAIMAVLIGIIAPQFFRYIDKSKASADLQNLRMIKSAVEVYYTDKGVSTNFKLTTTGTDVTIESDDEEEILDNAGLTGFTQLKSSKWTDIEIEFDTSTGKWSLSGTNSIDTSIYDVSKL